MDEEYAIIVDNVSKDFRLPHQRADSIKSLVTSSYKKGSPKVQRSNETQHALKNISLKIKKGEFYGVVGRNGSGKSTLLKILAGIYLPTEGKIKVNGKLVPFIELGVGFNGELTGRENVYLNGAMLGFSKKEIDNMYDSIVSFAELERFMDQKLKNYSSGMQVRLAFSMATRAQADILLVDEVLAVGDADFQRKCFNHFRKLKKDKKTVIFVSHDMGSIREYCDRAALIEKSKIVLEGKVNQVANAYTRMFMQETSSDKKKGSQIRRGTNEVQFLSVECPKEIMGMKPLVIRCTIKANKDVENLLLGFSVKNDADVQLVGTNTKIIKQYAPNLKKGEQLIYEWEVPNIFNDGSYFIDVAASNTDGENFDWWEEAALFTVFKEEKTPYVTTPEVHIVYSNSVKNKGRK